MNHETPSVQMIEQELKRLYNIDPKAVMLDRAMQLKGNYTKSKALPFSDKAKVGAYAKTSVERLYNYNVMGAMSGSAYQPSLIGTRAGQSQHRNHLRQINTTKI